MNKILKRLKNKKTLILVSGLVITLVYSVADSLGLSIIVSDDQLLNWLTQLTSILCLLGILQDTDSDTDNDNNNEEN